MGNSRKATRESRPRGLDINHESSRHDEFDGWALPLLTEWPKVVKVIKGGIPEPAVVEIFPTNHCNFNCPHCRFRDHHGPAHEHMDLDVFQRLLGELGERGVFKLELSGGGEPLDHPDIKRFLELMLEEEFRVGLITNGYPLVTNPGLIDPLLACADWIRISADGFTETTYRKVHGTTEGRYASLRSMIEQLASRRNDLPRIGLKILISKTNAKDALLAIPEAIELGVDYLQFKFLAAPEGLALPMEEATTLAQRIMDQVDEYKREPLHTEFAPPFSGEPSYERCLMTFLHPVIDWDGAIYLCAFFEHRKSEHSIGNIRDGGFFAHWDAPKHKTLFDGIDPCTCIPNCPMRRYNPVVEFIKSDFYRFGYV